jgi:hypothetical protein
MQQDDHILCTMLGTTEMIAFCGTFSSNSWTDLLVFVLIFLAVLSRIGVRVYVHLELSESLRF